MQYERLEPRQLLAADLLFGLSRPLNPVADSNMRATSQDGQWTNLNSNVVASQTGEPLLQLKNYHVFDLQEQALANVLRNAPLEFTTNFESRAVTISVPRPDLTFARFAIVESPIMAPALAAQFPDIKTYRGIGIDDPSATIRFDQTLHGFHAQVLSPNGNYYVDPIIKGQTELYASYSRSDLAAPTDAFHEHWEPAEIGAQAADLKSTQPTNATLASPSANSTFSAISFGTQLRTFRLANAATAEYTNFWGGTVALGQSAIVTAINRVTGIYENDLAIRLVLIANNSSLVFTDAAADPYTNNSGGTMLGQNQTYINSNIGSANYDIGHVFSTGGGGVAGLGVVGINSQKARGVTGLPSPRNDAFYIDYVAHEMGHQFGANHTFNSQTGNCGGGNRNSSTAFEPGSGSTIMGYAGICGSDNLQNNSDPVFHAGSIDEIRAHIATVPAAGTTSNTGNAIPSANAGLNYIIPASTPFELTAVGTDANPGNTLTYSWEQMDLGSAATLTTTDIGTFPLFRSWNPTTNPTRTFPRLSNLLSNTLPVGERLPTFPRASMDFRIVVRDNASGGGGVNTDDMAIQVVANGTGFSVTSQDAATAWGGLSAQSITWNVAGTTASPINAANVDIYFSSDGGLTFPTLLAAATPNDGSQAITVPNVSTSQGRIKVKASGNIFFDINNFNISITAAPTVNLTGPVALIPEGDTGTSMANFLLTLSAPPTSAVSVTYQSTNAGFSNPADGHDYTSITGTATFNPGDTSFPIPVTIFGDRFTEGVEQFAVTLSNPVGLSLGTSSVTASISDDDAFALGRPIDFGTLGSAVENGATGFSTGAYSAATGIGWTSSADMISYQLSFGTDVSSDLILNTTGNFQIDIPNGSYQVEAIIGVVDFNGSRANYPTSFASFSVLVEGVANPLILSPGMMVTRTFTATVTDGKLDIGTDSGFTRRRARLSGLVVTPLANRVLGNEDGTRTVSNGKTNLRTDPVRAFRAITTFSPTISEQTLVGTTRSNVFGPTSRPELERNSEMSVVPSKLVASSRNDALLRHYDLDERLVRPGLNVDGRIGKSIGSVDKTWEKFERDQVFATLSAKNRMDLDICL